MATKEATRKSKAGEAVIGASVASAQAGASAAATDKPLQIAPLNIMAVRMNLVGTSPLMQLAFGKKVGDMMAEKMTSAAPAANGKAKRKPRDFEEDMRQAMHVSTEGWVGVPAAAFRNAMISACRLVGFKMTLAKLSVFTEADGLDRVDGVPLVKLIAGEPETTRMAVRNATGVADLRVRPMWREWGIDLTVSFDADQFRPQDIVNLMVRAGKQVGIGEGRPDSRQSSGLGMGCFAVASFEVLK